MKGSPLDFARRGDASLHAYRGIEGRTTTLLDYDGHGQSQGEIEIRTPTVFRVEYPWMHYPANKKDQPISQVIVKSDGRVVDVVGARVKRKQTRPSSFRFYDARGPADWVFGLPKYVLASIHGEHALTQLVRAATLDPANFQVTFQIRDVVNKGVPGQQLHTVIDRVPSAAKRQGPLHLDFIADPKYGIPVEAHANMSPPGRKPVTVTWYAGWRKYDQFPDADFHVTPMR
jgi:hypothetical protein